MESIGTYIKARREALGLSQAEFARRVGTYQPEVSDWEGDIKVPRIPTLRRIAKALNVTLPTLARRLA